MRATIHRVFSATARLLLVLTVLEVSGQTDSTVLSKEISALEDYLDVNFQDGLYKTRAINTKAAGSGCRTCIGNAKRLLGKYYWANGEYPKGLFYFREALLVARQVNDLQLAASTLDLIGNTFYFQAYYDSATFYFKEALAVYQQEKNLQGMITVLHNISLMYHRKGDFKKAIEYLFQEERLKDQASVSNHEIEAMGAMGSLMIDSIYYRDAIKNELKLVTEFESRNDIRSLQRTYRNIGKSYRQLEEFVNAARYFVKASNVMMKIDMIPEWDLAAIDYRDGNMADSCFYYHHLSRQNFFRMTQPNVGYNIELLGDAHRHFGNFDSARLYYDSALRMNYRMNNRITFTGIHRNLVNVHTHLGNFKEAEYHLQTGLNLSKEVALIHAKNLFREGKQLYEKMGDYQKALYFSEKYLQYQDSINSAETAINLTRMQAEFKTAQKAREVDELSQQNLLHEAQLEARNLQVALAIAAIVIVTALGGWYFSRYRHKVRTSQILERQNLLIEAQNSELQVQNRAKEGLLREIHHRVKNNLQVISGLINLKIRQVPPETAITLQQLGNRIFTMGLIHEKLYQKEDVQLVRLDNYLREISTHLIQSLSETEYPVELKMDFDPVEIDVDRALSCGLICNELLTNSMKYAFVGDHPDRKIELILKTDNASIDWTIRDNGSAVTTASPNDTKSFGLRFVDQLVSSKLAGTWKVERNNGYHTYIRMPAPANGKN